MAGRIHEHRFEQLVREGHVAPAVLLSDYSLRRRRATLAAAVIDLEARLADAAIEMFGKQTGLLFARARAAQKRGIEILQKPTRMDFGFTFVGLDPDGHRLRVFAPA